MTEFLDPNPTDDPEIAALVRDFVAKLPDRAAAIEGARDVAIVARLAHQLVGAAACYGFATIAAAARRVEDLAKAGDGFGELGIATAALAQLCRDPSTR